MHYIIRRSYLVFLFTPTTQKATLPLYFHQSWYCKVTEHKRGLRGAVGGRATRVSEAGIRVGDTAFGGRFRTKDQASQIITVAQKYLCPSQVLLIATLLGIGRVILLVLPVILWRLGAGERWTERGGKA